MQLSTCNATLCRSALPCSKGRAHLCSRFPDGRCITDVKEERCELITELALQLFCIALLPDASKDMEILLDQDSHSPKPNARRCTSDHHASLTLPGSHAAINRH